MINICFVDFKSSCGDQQNGIATEKNVQEAIITDVCAVEDNSVWTLESVTK